MYRQIIYLLTIFTIAATNLFSADYTISGIVTSKISGEPIPDANITVLNTTLGTASGDGGYYALSVPRGSYEIKITVIGYHTVRKLVTITGSVEMNIALESKVIEYDPVIVTATLLQQLKSNVTMNTTVLSRKEIDELKGVTGGEILESVSGVYVKSSDGISGVNTPSIRGSDAGQVLVLLDGVRLNTAQGSSVDLNCIPLAAIERVEVLKGGHSALLGSDAVGGVINLISKNGIGEKGFSYGVSTTAGSFGTVIYTLRGERTVGPLSLFAGYNRTKTDGNFTYKDNAGFRLTRENNDSQTNSLFVKTKFDLNKANTFTFTYHTLLTEKGIAGNINLSPFTGLPMTTPEARSENRKHVGQFEGSHQLSGNFLVKETVSLHNDRYHFIDPAGWTPADDTHKNNSLKAQVLAQYRYNPHFSATAGASYQIDALQSTTFTGIDDRIQTSYFGQAEFRKSFDKFFLLLTPSVRTDNYSDTDSRTSPKIGFLLSEGTGAPVKFKLNYGSSYRVPSFNDLYWPADAYTAGNPDLEPEIGRNFDMGITLSGWENGLFEVETAYFNNQISNLISWQSGADWIWRPENVGNASIAGLEMGIRYRHPENRLYLNLFYTYLQATEQTKGSSNRGNRLIYRPDHKIDIQGGYQIYGVQANVNYRIVSESYTAADNSSKLDGYSLLNANLKSEVAILGMKLSVKLQAVNLFNKMIFLSDGYPLPGREYRCTVGINY